MQRFAGRNQEDSLLTNCLQAGDKTPVTLHLLQTSFWRGEKYSRQLSTFARGKPGGKKE
jgi:hypothetical protein